MTLSLVDPRPKRVAETRGNLLFRVDECQILLGSASDVVRQQVIGGRASTGMWQGHCLAPHGALRHLPGTDHV